MSIDVSMQINLNKIKCKSLLEILQVLSISGWNFIHNNRITYSLTNKAGDVEFEAAEFTLEQFDEMVQQRKDAYELISIEMTWMDSGSGGPLMFRPNDGIHELIFYLESKRQKLTLVEGCEITNFQWYLHKLLPPLDKAFGLESFSFKEQY